MELLTRIQGSYSAAAITREATGQQATPAASGAQFCKPCRMHAEYLLPAHTPHTLHTPSLQDLACVHTRLGSEASHVMNDRRVPRLRLEVPGKRPRFCI